jgi:hypothetical protein
VQGQEVVKVSWERFDHLTLLVDGVKMARISNVEILTSRDFRDLRRSLAFEMSRAVKEGRISEPDGRLAYQLAYQSPDLPRELRP